MDKDCRIVIIIPSYEPDDRLLGLLNLLNQNLFSVVLVNDGSDKKYDMYFDAAESKYGVEVIRYSVNQGKGYAIKKAFEYCIETYTNLQGCITVDSDGQHSIKSIMKLKTEAEKSKESLILGVRDFNGPQVPDKSKFGNNLTRKMFKLLYRVDISDTQTGLRYIPKSFMLELLHLKENRFEFETKMLIEAIKNKVAIKEVGIETIYDSKENHQTHFRPIVDSVRIYKLFLGNFCRYVLSSLSSCIIDLFIFNTICIVCRRKFDSYIYISLATIIARVFSSIYNYMVNYRYVFMSKKKHRATMIRYFGLVVIQMCLSACLTSLFVTITGVSAELYVKIPVDLGLFFVSYYIQKRYVY